MLYVCEYCDVDPECVDAPASRLLAFVECYSEPIALLAPLEQQ